MDTLGQNVQKSEKTMEDAIEIVSEFLENEYGSVDDDFDDLTNISLAYTDFLDEETNEEHPSVLMRVVSRLLTVMEIQYIIMM